MAPIPSLAEYPLWWMGLGLSGLAVGIVGGMFGVGGNFLLIPMLHVAFGVPLNIAVGTSVCQTIGTGVAALRRHQRLKQGEIRIDWLMLAGGLIGAQAGAYLLSLIAGLATLTILGHSISAIKFWLSLLYIIILSIVAFWMIYDSRVRPANAPLHPGPLTRIPLPPYITLPNCDRRVSVLVMAYLGLLIGLLSGLVGMGGGVVLMPILIYGLGVRVRMAAGTGILALVVSALAATGAHAMLGNVHLGLAMMLLAGSTLGANLGASISHTLDGQRLRGLFGFLVLVTAMAVLSDLVRVLTARPH
jgi:uncharacterized membrane protein YfcA